MAPLEEEAVSLHLCLWIAASHSVLSLLLAIYRNALFHKLVASPRLSGR